MTHYNMPVLHHIPVNQMIKKYIPVYYPIPVEHRINIPVKIPIKIPQRVIIYLINLDFNSSSSSLWSKGTCSCSCESRNS
jgi:hypothetical protein